MYSARHEQFLDGGAEAAFEQNGTAAFAKRFEQREVLHVARADLHDVGIVGHQFDVAIAHHFGDDGEAGGLLGFVRAASGLLLPCPGNRRAKCGA